MKTEFYDNNHILTPRPISFINCPLLEVFSNKKSKHWEWGECYIDNSSHMRKALALIHTHIGQITTRMLDVYRDGGEHHYNDVCRLLGIYQGHDIDCWRSLVDKGLIEFSSKHSYGSKYYKITPFGQEVLGIVDANNVCYKVLRWYKLDGDELIEAMIKADLNGEDASNSQEPPMIIAMFDALLDPSSRIRQVGSAYRWMNKVISLIDNNDEFYEKATHPEVMAWIASNKGKSAEHMAFFNKICKIQKKRARKAAKALCQHDADECDNSFKKAPHNHNQ